MQLFRKYAARRAASVPVVSCSLVPMRYLAARDTAAWEVFDEDALKEYLARGAQELSLRIDQLAEPSHSLDENGSKELFFMLESLVYAKSLLPEKSSSISI